MWHPSMRGAQWLRVWTTRMARPYLGCLPARSATTAKAERVRGRKEMIGGTDMFQLLAAR